MVFINDHDPCSDFQAMYYIGNSANTVDVKCLCTSK